MPLDCSTSLCLCEKNTLKWIIIFSCKFWFYIQNIWAVYKVHYMCTCISNDDTKKSVRLVDNLHIAEMQYSYYFFLPMAADLPHQTLGNRPVFSLGKWCCSVAPTLFTSKSDSSREGEEGWTDLKSSKFTTHTHPCIQFRHTHTPYEAEGHLILQLSISTLHWALYRLMKGSLACVHTYWDCLLESLWGVRNNPTLLFEQLGGVPPIAYYKWVSVADRQTFVLTHLWLQRYKYKFCHERWKLYSSKPISFFFFLTVPIKCRRGETLLIKPVIHLTIHSDDSCIIALNKKNNLIAGLGWPFFFFPAKWSAIVQQQLHSKYDII